MSIRLGILSVFMLLHFGAVNCQQMDEAAAYMEQGRIAFKNQEYDKAAISFSKVRELSPNNDTALFNRGLTYLNLKKLEKAEADLSGFIQSNPQDAEALVIRSRIYFDQEKYEAGMLDMNKAVEILPRISWVIMRGQAYLQTGNFLMAERDFRSAIERESQNADAWQGLGDVLFAKDDFILALQAYTKALEAQPDHRFARYQAGITAAKLHHYSLALQYLDDQVVKDQNAKGLAARAYCHYRLGNLENARTDAIKANNTDISNADAYNVLGLIHLQEKRFEEALNFFRETLEWDSRHAQAYYNAGITAYQIGHLDDAASFLAQATDYQEVRGAAFMALANIKLTIGDRVEACAYFKKASEVGYEAHPEENVAVYCKE